MKYHIRKGPEYSASSVSFSLDELEHRLRTGQIDGAYQVRGQDESTWRSLSEISSVTPDVAAVAEEARIKAQAHSNPEGVADLLRLVVANQERQLKQLAAIRWAIIGFSIWFVIQLWLLPRIWLDNLIKR